MATVAPAALTTPTAIARDPERWIVPTIVVATTSIVVGAVWDISWHMTVGRDTFWTPAHIAIQLGGIIAAVVCVLWSLRAVAKLSPRTLLTAQAIGQEPAGDVRIGRRNRVEGYGEPRVQRDGGQWDGGRVPTKGHAAAGSRHPHPGSRPSTNCSPAAPV